MDENQALEVQYSPSLFTRRFKSSDELRSYYLDYTTKGEWRNLKTYQNLVFVFAESEKSRQNHNCHLNIAYGPTSREKLDIYGDDLKADSPLFVYVHGGYWQRYGKWNSAYVVAPLVQKGVRVIIVGYELCPQVGVEDIVAQVQKAFEWISEYVEKHSIKSVSIAGHSVGAHLVACSLNEKFTASLKSDVKLFVYLISGIYDLSEVRYCKSINTDKMFAINDGNVNQLSPQSHNFNHLVNRDIKIYVFVGEFESEKFQQQSKEFAEIALINLRSVSCKICSAVDHFDIVEKLSEEDYEMTQIVLKNVV